MSKRLTDLITEEISILLETPADVVYQKYYATHLGGSLKNANPALHHFQQTDPDQDVSRKIFYKIISADPTTPIKNGKPDKLGKYSQWLLRLFINNRLKLEDLYKATDYLKIFDRYKQNELIPVKDINKLKTLPELFKNIEKQFIALKTGTPQTSGELERYVKEKETRKVYEDNKWLVVIPLTHRSACYYGKNTQWCTASNDDDDHFKHYTAKGPLFINIEKGTGRKYQFHFEDGQFMDETDSPIDFTEFFENKENIPLRDFYVNFIVQQKKDKKQGFDIGRDGVELHFEGDTPYLHAGSWSDFAEFFYERGSSRHGINKEFIRDVLDGDSSKWFYSDSGHVDHRDWINQINKENKETIQAYIDKVGLDDDNEDMYDQDNVARAIRHAVSECEEVAAQDAAYEYLTDQIISHFSVIRTDWATRNIKTKDGIKKREFLKLQIQPNAAKNLILYTFFNGEGYSEDYDKDHPLGIEYESPYYGWSGDITDEMFNDVLSYQLSEELN